jgi:hypothetical protein
VVRLLASNAAVHTGKWAVHTGMSVLRIASLFTPQAGLVSCDMVYEAFTCACGLDGCTLLRRGRVKQIAKTKAVKLKYHNHLFLFCSVECSIAFPGTARGMAEAKKAVTASSPSDSTSQTVLDLSFQTVPQLRCRAERAHLDEAAGGNTADDITPQQLQQPSRPKSGPGSSQHPMYWPFDSTCATEHITSQLNNLEGMEK